MDREQVIREISNLLSQHIKGCRGSIHQEPYKGDFFRLFATAFNAGLIESPGQPGHLSADALTDILSEKFPETVDNETFHNLHTFWQEWTYAWKRCSEIRR